MTTLHEAAQQALEFVTSEAWGTTPYMDVRVYEDAAKLRDVLRAALKQEAEAAAWLAERKNHWRKEREKAQAAKDQDPELSAALGWPGGISNPVLDRVQLLQMVAAMAVASQQALDNINELFAAEQSDGGERGGHIRTPATREHLVRVARARKALHESCDNLRAALAQEQAEPLTIERLRDALVASRIIPPAAVEDPDEYDDGVTLHRIEALHRRLT